jgi:hypothetical protein
MAAEFLDQLSRVPTADLDDTICCYICHEDFALTPTERGIIIDEPVRTPCSHILGSVCLSAWVTLGNNTCPCCRQELFKQERSTIDFDELEDGEISDNADIYSDQHQDEISAGRFLDHIRAIQAVLRSRGDRTGETQWMAWLREYHNIELARPSEDSLGEAFNAMRRLWGVERDNGGWLIRVASARRTRRLREYRLYLQLRAGELGIQYSAETGPSVQPQVISMEQAHSWDQAPCPQSQLTSEQETWLLRKLVFRGGFGMVPWIVRNDMRGEADFRRQWDLIRDAGYVYDPNKISEEGELLGKWSLAPY